MATLPRNRIMAIFCLMTALYLLVSVVPVGAQSGIPGICTGEELSPCGFPIGANPSEMVGNATIHDSCIPEGACPWIQGVDIWWPDQAGPNIRPTTLVSVMKGKVITACRLDGVGNLVVTVQNDYFTAYYLHVDSCIASVGQDVEIGSPLAIMGNTGRSTLPHLHFALKYRSEQYSLRLAGLMPLLEGWSKVSGLDPSPVTYFGSLPSAIKIDDLPYAEAGEVTFFVAYTPTPEMLPTMVVTQAPTMVPVVPTVNVQPTPATDLLPRIPADVRNNLPLVILALLVLAFIFARNETDEKPSRKGEGGHGE